MPFDASRWMTQRRAHPRIGPDYQAPIPDLIRDPSANVAARVPVQWLQGPFHSPSTLPSRNDGSVNISASDLAPCSGEQKVDEGVGLASEAHGVRTRLSAASGCLATSRRQGGGSDATESYVSGKQSRRAGVAQEDSGLPSSSRESAVVPEDFIHDSVNVRSAESNGDSGREPGSSLASLVAGGLGESGEGGDESPMERQGEFVLSGRAGSMAPLQEAESSSLFAQGEPPATSVGEQESSIVQCASGNQGGTEGDSVGLRGCPAIDSHCVTLFSSSTVVVEGASCRREGVSFVGEAVSETNAEKLTQDSVAVSEADLSTQLRKLENESGAQAGRPAEVYGDGSASAAELLGRFEVPAADVMHLTVPVSDGGSPAGGALRDSRGPALKGEREGSVEGDRETKRLRTAAE